MIILTASGKVYNHTGKTGRRHCHYAPCVRYLGTMIKVTIKPQINQNSEILEIKNNLASQKFQTNISDKGMLILTRLFEYAGYMEKSH